MNCNEVCFVTKTAHGTVWLLHFLSFCDIRQCGLVHQSFMPEIKLSSIN